MPSVALNLVLAEARVYSGDSLEATVLLDSADPDAVISEFYAEVRGVGRTGWVNIHTDKIYETEQEYLNIVLPLCHQMMPLKPGRHRFQLRVAIPDSMPSSFESEFGSIRYTVKISLLTNADHAIMQPIDYRDEIDFTVCSLPFGTVYLRISLPRTAFCLGETIAAKIHVRNATRKAVKDCRLQLLLKTQFEAKSRYEHANDRKLVEQVVDTWPMGRVKARTEMNFEECCLRVPETATPTHHQASSAATRGSMQAGNGFTDSGLGEQGQSQQPPSIIILSYVLRFNALPGIETEIPLIITSHPFCNGTMEQVVEEEEEEEWTEQPQEVYKR